MNGCYPYVASIYVRLSNVTIHPYLHCGGNRFLLLFIAVIKHHPSSISSSHWFLLVSVFVCVSPKYIRLSFLFFYLILFFLSMPPHKNRRITLKTLDIPTVYSLPLMEQYMYKLCLIYEGSGHFNSTQDQYTKCERLSMYWFDLSSLIYNHLTHEWIVSMVSMSTSLTKGAYCACLVFLPMSRIIGRKTFLK